MAHVRRHRPAAVLGALLLVLAPQVARADLMIPLDDGVVGIKGRRALISSVGATESLIDEIAVRSTSSRFLWVRPFPVEPKRFEPVDKPFARLRELSIVRPPYNELIRDDLFGPSIVSVLIDRLFREPPPLTDDPSDKIEPRQLEVGTMTFFSGQVTSSTTTYQLYLPDAFQAFVASNGIKLDQKQIGELAIALNRGWTVMTAIVSDNAPASDRLAQLGPFGFNFRTQNPMYPMANARRRPTSRVPFDFYFVANHPLVSSSHETIWDVRPWEGLDANPGQFRVDYNDVVVPESPIAIELAERLNVQLPTRPRLLHMSFVHPRGSSRELTFIRAKNPVEIPAGTRRGSAFDIFLCILLGLTPLLYTPESWFLLWLASRARARARAKGSAFGTRLWSVYAIIVGLYWFVVLPDAARIAGIVPLLIGIVQLALPYTARDKAPVRVDFKRKARAKN